MAYNLFYKYCLALALALLHPPLALHCSAFFSIILCHLFYSLAVLLCRYVAALRRLSSVSVVCQDASPVVSTLYSPLQPLLPVLHMQLSPAAPPTLPFPWPAAARSMQRVTCASSVIFRFASTPHNIFAVIFHMWNWTLHLGATCRSRRRRQQQQHHDFFPLYSVRFSAPLRMLHLTCGASPTLPLLLSLPLRRLWRCFDTANARACL